MSDRTQIHQDAQFYSELMRAYFDSTNDAIFVLCDEMKFLACNTTMEHWLGQSEQELTLHNQRRPITELLGDNYDVSRFRRYFQRALQGEPVVFETCISPPQGEKRWVDINFSRVNVESGDMVIAVARDISERKKHLATIEFQASYDSLTELPNRDTLVRFLQNVKPAGRASSLSVMAVDIEHFKSINETLGQQAADRVLQELARRLQRLADISCGDFLARLGGDTFVLAVPDINLQMARATAHRIRQVAARPIDADGRDVVIDCGIGIAAWPEHADEPVALIALAESAMHVAKARKLGVSVCDGSTSRPAAERRQLAAELGEALRDGAIHTCYQPVVNMQTRQVHAEVLARWPHPQRGEIAPREFVALAEETGLIDELNRYVFSRALGECAALLQKRSLASLAFNLSAGGLQQRTLAADLRACLEQHAVTAEQIVLEIAEPVLMSSLSAARQLFDVLHRMGVRFAVDDYGTGCSPLPVLKQLPLQALKLDQSLIRDVAGDDAQADVANAAIQMAHALGLEVVAEGIENERTWARLKQLGCDFGQGSWLAEPMPAAELRHWRVKVA